jgi:hypothetical protein
LLVTCMVSSSTLKVEAERSSETSMNICRTTRHHTSGDYSSSKLKYVGSGPGFAMCASYGEGCPETQGRVATKGTRLELNKKRPISGAHWCIVILDPWNYCIVVGGVQLESTRHVGHWLAYCICPRWLWWWRIWWNEDWQGKPKYSEKTCPSFTLSTTNPTLPDPGSNPGRRGGKPATNRLSYGAAFM